MSLRFASVLYRPVILVTLMYKVVTNEHDVIGI